MTHERRIDVGGLSRVEGEGSLKVTVEDGRATSVMLDIYEPPRFFEALLRGRHFTEPPDITARICGICPIAYQMSAVQAIEDACGVTVTPAVQALRRLIYCGEWIESHALHVFLLHAPDFLGFDSGIAMANAHRDLVQKGLRLKRAGNRLIEVIGGRSVHPVNVRVGGFYRAPSRQELSTLIEELSWARDAALETVQWVSTFEFPDFEQDYEFVALSHPERYAIIEGRIASSIPSPTGGGPNNRNAGGRQGGGLDIAVSEYEDYFEEEQVAYSTALHSHFKGDGPYLVGPLARYALNGSRLSANARQAAAAAGLGPVCRNPFRSIIVRAVEIVYACDEALRLIEEYEPPEPPAMPVEPKAAVGHGASEAPRGLLYHRYRVGEDGTILEAKIVPPTSQNQRMIEDDVRGVVERSLDLPDEALQWRAEQAIRNYDPCISCSTHFLEVTVERR